MYECKTLGQKLGYDTPKLKDTDQKQFKNNFWSDVQN